MRKVHFADSAVSGSLPMAQHSPRRQSAVHVSSTNYAASAVLDTEPILPVVRRCRTAVASAAWPRGRPSNHWAQLPNSIDGVHSPYYRDDDDDANPQLQRASYVISKLDAIIEGTVMCGTTAPSREASSARRRLGGKAHSLHHPVLTGRTGALVAISAALVSVCLIGATSLALVMLGWVYLSTLCIVAEIVFWLHYLHRYFNGKSGLA